jgi:hypothetical protein
METKSRGTWLLWVALLALLAAQNADAQAARPARLAESAVQSVEPFSFKMPKPIPPAPRRSPAVQSVEPFGFKMGMTRDQVVAAVGAKAIMKEADGGDMLFLSTAPKPYADVQFYLVVISAKSGLAKVLASSKTLQVNSFGTELQEKFREYEDALQEKYGKPTNASDFLRAGSVWDQPGDWMMGLLKNERVLGDLWSLEQPPGYTITLEAVADSPDTGYVRLTYEFPNFSSWLREHDKKANAVF